MEVNKEQAEKCRDLGAEAFHRSDLIRALKLLNKSLKPHPLADVEALLGRTEGLKPQHWNHNDTSHLGRNRGGDGVYHTTQTRTNGSSASTAGSGSAAHRGTPALPPWSHSAPVSSSEADRRARAEEQAAVVQKILRAKESGLEAHYCVLGVAVNCTEADLKKAYRKLSLKVHPDKNSAPLATETFKTVGLAYTSLSDPQQRAIYDRFANEERNKRGGGAGGPGGVHTQAGTRTSASSPSTAAGGSAGHRGAPDPPQPTSSAHSGADRRAYTEAQATLVQKILRAKESGPGAHYCVLGVAVNCTKADLKKAFQEISVKVHPDKNSAPLAAEAFKAQRAFYDRFANNEPNKRRGSAGGPGGMHTQPATGTKGASAPTAGGGSAADRVGADPPGRTSSTPVSSSGADRRAYTEEQVTLVQKILRAKESGPKAHFCVLGVAVNCTEADLKKAFQEISVKVHPEKNSAPHAAEAFKTVGLAYATLSDPQQRAIYDRFACEVSDKQAGRAGTRPARKSSKPVRRSSRPVRTWSSSDSSDFSSDYY